MLSLISIILGGALAVAYVGFFAISVGKPALLVIVGACLCLMFVSLWQDLRDSRNAR